MRVVKIKMVKKTKENEMKCICPSCPSYNDCMKHTNERLFCANGKSKCKFEKKGCICMGCPITSENNLKGGYWCLTGSAK